VKGYDLGLPIETERMTIRALRAADGPDIHAIFADPEVSRYLYTEPLDAAGALTYATERSNPVISVEGQGVNLAGELRETGRVVATFFIKLSSEKHAQGEIGYVVSPSYAGRGLASEGATAMLSIGFDRWDLHRMIGQCDARNAASAGVMRRIGMRQEALLRENEWTKGEWTDELIFAMLAEEWNRRGARGGADGERGVEERA
jgi:RimJ/RimL family protein N-acetyltransferase